MKREAILIWIYQCWHFIEDQMLVQAYFHGFRQYLPIPIAVRRIIPEDIPELLSYMDEVMPDKSNEDDTEGDVQDIEINIGGYLPEKEMTGAKEKSN